MTKSKLIPRTVFLGLTALVLGMEIWFSADGNPNTEPWTVLIVDHFDGELIISAIGALTAWLFAHFIVRIIEKRKIRNQSQV